MTRRIAACVRLTCLLLTGWLLAAATLASPASAQDEAVLIVDHSGSMWARMEGSPKISIVRNAVGALLPDRAGKLDLGILTYGSRKKNKCDAVEAIKPVDTINPEIDAKTLSGVMPKGSAPVASALKKAAGLFKTESGARTIILVSDSTDDCEADPCAVAEELKSQSPLTVIHTIGFDAEASEKLDDIACISEATGGVFTAAQNTSELNSALSKAFQLAEAGLTQDANGRAVPVALSNEEEGAPPGEEGFSSNEPGTVVLSAMLAKGTPELSKGVVWRVYDGRVQQDGSYRLLHTFDQARTVVTLPPGDYLINAAYGRANLTKRITIWPGKRKEDLFNLNAGGLRLYATLDGKPLISEQSLSFDVYSDETDQFGNRRRAIAGARSGVVLRLNSGNYRIESTYGDANSVMIVDAKVEPGKLTEATIDHQAGKVTFRLVEQPGGEALADTIWRIYASDGQLVKKSGGAFPSHVLAAGDYSVRVEHGEMEYAAKFGVGVGDKKQVEVVKP